jgi:uncharacterized protein (TIGR02118 family)
MYPRQAGKTFDLEYYIREHMALVHEKMDALGLQQVEVDGGIPGLDGQESPFFAIGHLQFHSFEEYEMAFTAVGKDLIDDIPNYSNVEPLVFVGEVTNT